jgi:hypothetical protein
MSAVSNLWRQLVQRRLLPVAIILIAGLVAVPLLLAKDPEPVPAPPPVQVDTKSELAKAPIVTPASAEERFRRRKVLGAAKNPFQVKTEPADNAPAADSGNGGGTSPDASKPADTGVGGFPDTGSTPSAGTPIAPTTPVAPTPAPKVYEPEELTVRFGSEADAKRRSVQKLQPLPSAELPTLIYMGVMKDGKTAVFLVDAGVTPVGDGECDPSPEQCETLHLRAGETEFLDVTDESGTVTQQFQLDLIKIHNVKKSASSSRSTKSAGLKSGPRRTELRSVAGRVSAYLP